MSAAAAIYSINSVLFSQVVSKYTQNADIPLQMLIYAWAVSMIDNNNASVKNTAAESDAYATLSSNMNQLLAGAQALQFTQDPSLTATDHVVGYSMQFYQAATSLGFASTAGSIDPHTSKPVLTIGELQALTESIKSTIDTLSNTTQKTQLRLQQVIGTMNTATETTSNMMSKVFTAIDRVTSNIGR